MQTHSDQYAVRGRRQACGPSTAPVWLSAPSRSTNPCEPLRMLDREACWTQRTVKVPSIPAEAWPSTVHRYGYLPAFLNVTVSLAVLPGLMSGVCFPPILKSCRICPTFLTTKVTLPGFFSDLLESLK